MLVRTGETVDILLDVTNPGVWMAHCHIAEHHESGMMFSFTVEPAPGTPPLDDVQLNGSFDRRVHVGGGTGSWGALPPRGWETT